MAIISAEDVDQIKAKMDSYTTKPEGIPGLVCTIVDRKGEQIFHHVSGRKGFGSAEHMTSDTLFWFASCTKLITSITAMQLVEQGRLALDDEDQLEEILPEMKMKKVLDESSTGELRLVEKKRKITLRMLLSHTAGFGYSFSSAKLKKWSEPIGISEVSSEEYDIFEQPLVNQPGETWEYGVNIDWVGRMVERVTGLSLDEYFREFIFQPLGISNITFFPRAETHNLALMHCRRPDGKLELRQDGHILHKPLVARTPEARKTVVNAGGHGCFGTPIEYCEIIAALLNHGTHSKTGATILKQDTVNEMLKNQIPHLPDFGRGGEQPAKPAMVNFEAEIYSQLGDPPQGWGLSFFKLLHAGPTGRAAGTVWWSGVANLIWWADMETGIGGMIASQILPYADPEFMTCHEEVETLVYAALKKNASQE